MKKAIVALALFFVSQSCFGQDIIKVRAEDVVKFASSPDTVYIINFWATWCMPCVQELPEFNDLDKIYKGKPVKILMVSLDFKDAYPYKLKTFVERKRLTPQVAWLSETDPNIFIPKIEESWEGSIPATLIIKPGTGRKFTEGQVTAGQVSKIVDEMMAANKD
jgi:thiol-disulfide isomerase/thioredoxin